MAFYFFADISNLNIQSSGGYGPAANTVVNSVEYEQFLVTSKHSATADVDAIAVCKGQILVQEQSSNSDLLNIVLKPMDTQPFGFPKIKYFIYKGIRKDTLIAENNIELTPENTNDLVKSIWTSFKKRNASGIPAKSILGLQSDLNSLPDSTQLDEVFATVYTAVQFWNIQAGDTLGKFDKNSIGFEIILDALFYKPTLELTRSSETYVRVKSLITSPLQKDFFEHWHDKETILNFLDPCAFWGSFYNEKLSVRVSGVRERWQGIEIYTNVLSKFVNKNTAYIDIRNEFNYSINYFKNYGISATDNTTDMKISRGTAGQAAVDYYHTGWPLFILDNTGFNASSDNHQLIDLQLPTGNGDNPNPLIFFSKAYKATGNSLQEMIENEKFLHLNVINNYTDDISFSIPWLTGNGCLCSYTLLRFNKRNSDTLLPSPQITQIRRNDYLDALFPLKLDFDYNAGSRKTIVYFEEIYLDLLSSDYYQAVFSLGIDFSLSNVLLYANPTLIATTERKRKPLVDAGSFPNPSGNQSYLKNNQITGQSKLKKKVLRISGQDVDTLEFETANVDVESRSNVPDIRKMIALNFTIEQWQNLLTSSNNAFLEKFPQYISIQSKNHLTDDDTASFTTLTIGSIGYVLDGNTIKVNSIVTDINMITNGHF